jgi:hypothetical protein
VLCAKHLLVTLHHYCPSANCSRIPFPIFAVRIHEERASYAAAVAAASRPTVMSTGAAGTPQSLAEPTILLANLLYVISFWTGSQDQQDEQILLIL